MTPNTTPRGFAMYAEVQIGGDGYDPITTFTVQESSLARERRVWVGKSGLNRAHLDESQARAVRDGLSAFLGDDMPSRDGEELASAIERGDQLTEVEQLRVVVATLRGRIARLISRPDDVFESDDAAYAWLADEARRGGSEIPTTEDREALAHEAWLNYCREHGYATHPTHPDTGADFSAGFEAGYAARRPSPPTEKEILRERSRQIEKGYDADHDDEHGLDHLLLWAQRYGMEGKHLESLALVQAAREYLPRHHPSPPTEEQWEYVPGHRWVDANGQERWFVQGGVIGPATVDEYLAEGGEVIRRKVGPWEPVEAAARVGGEHAPDPTSPTGRIDSFVSCKVCGRGLLIAEDAQPSWERMKAQAASAHGWGEQG